MWGYINYSSFSTSYIVKLLCYFGIGSSLFLLLNYCMTNFNTLSKSFDISTMNIDDCFDICIDSIIKMLVGFFSDLTKVDSQTGGKEEKKAKKLQQTINETQKKRKSKRKKKKLKKI